MAIATKTKLSFAEIKRVVLHELYIDNNLTPWAESM